MRMVLDWLQHRHCDPRPTGHNTWDALCPIHKGDVRQLSIKQNDDGTVSLECREIEEFGHSPGRSSRPSTA
jgi:hypothetical protein